MNHAVRILACITLATAAAGVLAQDYPAKPVRLISPYPPGGVVDLAARVIGAKLSDLWKHQAVVETRAGGGGVIGTEFVAKAAADGYTVLFATVGEFAITPHAYSRLGYDVERDFAPVSIVTETPLLWAANANAPFNTLAELIAHAKAQPKGLSFASAGNATLNHLTGERFAVEVPANLVHVPYKGGGPAGAAIVAGEVQVGVVAASVVAAHIKAGRIKPLAVTADRRIALGPDWPTVVEAGFPTLVASQWVGVAVPSGTPRAVIDKLNTDINTVLKQGDLRERFSAVGSEATGTTPAQMGARIRTESAQFAAIVKRIGLKLD